MLDSIDIGCLYEKVLEEDMRRYNITDNAVSFGIECMQHVYSGDKNLQTERSQVADYTDPAHRCAYLHKYAALHTAMVRDMLGEAVNTNFSLFRHLVFSGSAFRICSLGGGPGTDIIGALASLHAAFGYFECSATVVDYMAEWSYSFDSILKELGTGWYGAFGNNISHYLNWQYVGANLLKRFNNEVNQALSTASLVTMVKFTSAAACKDTSTMIRNIFTAMKPGSLLLFIDNDGGGFHNLIEDAAKEFSFIPIFGPFRRENYLNSFFKKRKFGYNSCCKTTVTVHVLQKPFVMSPYNIPHSLVDPYMPPKESFGSPPTPFVYLGQSPDINGNEIIPASARSPLLPASARSPLLPASARSPLLPASARSPLLPLPNPYGPATPFMDNNRLGYASAYDARSEFVYNENIYNGPDFVSPPFEIPQSPSSYMPSHIATPATSNFVNSPLNASFRHAIYTPTPNGQPRAGKRARMQGCFPLKISNFRHHISNRLNNMKAQARNLFKKKKNKKNKHPIFKL